MTTTEVRRGRAPVRRLHGGESPVRAPVAGSSTGSGLCVSLAVYDEADGRAVVLVEKQAGAFGEARVKAFGIEVAVAVLPSSDAEEVARSLARPLAQRGLLCEVRRAIAEELDADAVLLEVRPGRSTGARAGA